MPGVTLSRGQEHFLDVRHDAVWEYKGEVPGHGILKRGYQVIAAKAFFCCTASPLEVTKGLYHDTAAAEHVGKLGNVLAVFNGLVKGLGEVLADKKGKVGVVGLIFLGLVGMSVDNRKPVLVVFRGHFPGWVGTGRDLSRA